MVRESEIEESLLCVRSLSVTEADEGDWILKPTYELDVGSSGDGGSRDIPTVSIETTWAALVEGLGTRLGTRLGARLGARLWAGCRGDRDRGLGFREGERDMALRACLEGARDLDRRRSLLASC